MQRNATLALINTAYFVAAVAFFPSLGQANTPGCRPRASLIRAQSESRDSNDDGFSILTCAEQAEVLHEFAARRRFAFEEEVLGLRRSGSLREELIRRGLSARLVTADGYASLRAVSRANVERLSRALVTPAAALPEVVQAQIEDIVRRLYFSYTLASGASDPGLPVLSVEALRQLQSVPRTGSHFLRALMGSMNNVIFHARPALRKLGPVAEPTPDFALDDEFARQHGWISPAVSSPRDLLRLARASFPERLAPLMAYHNWPSATVLDSVRIDAPEIGPWPDHLEWINVIEGLADLDFTPDDFSVLMAATFRAKLADLYAHDAAGFTGAVASLENDAELQRFFRDYVTEPLGLGARLELKVPIAVPRNRVHGLVLRDLSSEEVGSSLSFDF